MELFHANEGCLRDPNNHSSLQFQVGRSTRLFSNLKLYRKAYALKKHCFKRAHPWDGSSSFRGPGVHGAENFTVLLSRVELLYCLTPSRWWELHTANGQRYVAAHCDTFTSSWLNLHQRIGVLLLSGWCYWWVNVSPTILVA